jgi:hypothetical protein
MGFWARTLIGLHVGVDVMNADPDIVCYRLSYYMTHDPEAVWELVQRHGGYISVQHGGHYEFYLARDLRWLLILAFPQLVHQPEKDLYT